MLILKPALHNPFQNNATFCIKCCINFKKTSNLKGENMIKNSNIKTISASCHCEERKRRGNLGLCVQRFSTDWIASLPSVVRNDMTR